MILNAFSANMLVTFPSVVVFREITLEEARKLAHCSFSAVGHADTARVFSTLLCGEVPMNRETVRLEVGDIALLGQYSGPRLPEGATALPEGATIKWLEVRVS